MNPLNYLFPPAAPAQGAPNTARPPLAASVRPIPLAQTQHRNAQLLRPPQFRGHRPTPNPAPFGAHQTVRPTLGAGPSGTNMTQNNVAGQRSFHTPNGNATVTASTDQNGTPVLRATNFVNIDLSSDEENNEEVSQKYFPGVQYPTSINVKKLFATFPLDKTRIVALTKYELIQFLEGNGIAYKATNCKELMFYKIKDFLDEKNKGAPKKKSNKNRHVASVAPAQKETILVTDEMLLELTPDAIAKFIEMRSKDAATILDNLIMYDAGVDPSQTKEQLLQKYFNLLSENARAENGITGRMQQEGDYYFDEKKPAAKTPRKSMIVVNECCICMENRLNTYIDPCGHVALCSECAKGVTQCPLCRAIIAEVKTVFFS